MKKLLLFITALILIVSVFTSCDVSKFIDVNDEDTTENEQNKDLGSDSGTGVNGIFDPNHVTFLSAYAQAKSLGFVGTLEEFIELISGKDGIDGKDGVGIRSISVDYNGNLIVYLTDGKRVDCGVIKAQNGKDGEDGITPTIEISEDGYWIINGTKTEYKASGADGVGIEKVELDENGDLLITLTNGKTHTVVMPEKVSHVHNFGEWKNYSGNENVFCENRLFYHICTACNVLEWRSGTYENHDFETVTTPATCVAKGYDTNTCKLCGFVEKTNETEIVDHSYETEYSYDGSFHWFDCENCDTKKDREEHTIDDTGYCTVCTQPLKATEGIIYDVSVDGTYAEVIDYTGDAKRIVIADTYNNLPVNKIFDNAFSGASITSIFIPKSIKVIGADAFSGCSSLKNVYIDNMESWCNITFELGTWTYKTPASNPLWYAEKLYLNGVLVTELIIPDTVEKINDYAFYNYNYLETVTIPDSVKSIGTEAFYKCSALTTVNIGNGVTSIEWQAFCGCESLVSVTIGKGITNIASQAFASCNEKLYTEYNSCRYVGNLENPYAVLIEVTNKNLSTYEINENTQVIAAWAFQECSRLTNINLPDSVTGISYHAFDNCTSLKSIVIPKNVLEIGVYAFYNCTSLKSIVIPISVLGIGLYAFCDCSAITDVYYAGTEEEWSEIKIELDGYGNSYLVNATKHYNYVSEEQEAD